MESVRAFRRKVKKIRLQPIAVIIWTVELAMSISEIGRKWVRDFLELGGEGRLLEGDAEEK